MKLIEIIASGIGKIWGFATSLILMGVAITATLFGLTVFFPEQVTQAFEILKSFIA